MGIFFALTTYALSGITNYIDKFNLEKYKIPPTVITVYSAIAALLGGLLVAFFTGFQVHDIRLIVILLISGVLTGIYLLPYYQALNLDETSRIVPLFQFVPIFVLILDFIFLGQELKPFQYLGSLFIIVGGYCLLIQKADLGMFKPRPAFWYMVVSSLLIAIATVLYKFGLETIPFWHTLPYEGVGIAFGALLITIYSKNLAIFQKTTRSIPRKVFLSISINEFIYVLSRYCGYFSLTLLSAGVFSVLSGFQPLFVMIFGIILSLWFPKIIKEVVNKKTVGLKIFSIALIFIGLYFIFF